MWRKLYESSVEGGVVHGGKLAVAGKSDGLSRRRVCRTYGARKSSRLLTQRLRAGLTSDAPPALKKREERFDTVVEFQMPSTVNAVLLMIDGEVLVQGVGGEAGEFVVFHGEGDLDGFAADFAVFHVGLAVDG